MINHLVNATMFANVTLAPGGYHFCLGLHRLSFSYSLESAVAGPLVTMDLTMPKALVTSGPATAGLAPTATMSSSQSVPHWVCIVARSCMLKLRPVICCVPSLTDQTTLACREVLLHCTYSSSLPRSPSNIFLAVEVPDCPKLLLRSYAGSV